MRGDKTRVKLGALVIATALVLMGMTALTGCIEEEEEVDEMRIGMTDEPGRFNPIEQTDVYSSQVFNNIFDTLTSTYPDGEIHTDGYGTLLEDYEISEDGLTYTFDLVDDAYFHHGEQVTAEDLAFSFRAHEGTAEEYYDVDDIPESPRQGDTEEVDDVEVVDETTFRMHLNDVNSEWLNSGLMAQLWALPHEWIEENSYEEFSDDFIGYGPYEFVEYSPGDEIVLEKYDDYHGENADIERIVFEVFDEEASAISAIRAGRIHYIPTIGATNYFDLVEEEDPDVNPVSVPSLGHSRIGFNHEEEPFDDARVRKAFAYAIDNEEVIDAVRTEDLATNLRTPVSEHHPAHYEDHNLYERDLDRAEELLEEAGYPDGPDMEIDTVVPTGDSEDEMVMVQEHVAEVGFDMDLRVVEFGTAVEEMEAGNWHVHTMGWTPTASAEYAMTYFRPTSPWNARVGWWNSTYAWRFEENITQALRSFGDEQIEHYQNAQEHLVDDMAAFIMYLREDPAVYHSDLDIDEEMWNPYEGPVTHLNYVEWAD